MPRYQRGLFIYNGTKDKQENAQQIQQTLPIIAQEVKSLQVIQTHSLDELRRICREIAPTVDVLFILGGDGTIHECINVLAPLDQRPVIGILPGGTCNDFSRMMQTPQNLEQAARSVIAGEEIQVDAGQANDHYFLNFWGAGLIAKTSTNIDDDQKDRFGVLSYFISALKTMNQADPFSFSITVDEEKLEGEAVMVVVMNGRFLGTRQLPVMSIDIHDQMLDLFIVKNSNLTLFRELMTMNRPGTDDRRFQELHHTQGKQITIEVDELQEVDMDGEIKGTTPASLSVLPNHFTFLKSRATLFGPKVKGNGGDEA
ncbi:YegS/Rv2252/BmrU family lipid kinase [Halobacillus fulvus]|nr:YegS/Rv2252/BmrU family lipid kinase [Halobacillus fulvus]